MTINQMGRPSTASELASALAAGSHVKIQAPQVTTYFSLVWHGDILPRNNQNGKIFLHAKAFWGKWGKLGILCFILPQVSHV